MAVPVYVSLALTSALSVVSSSVVNVSATASAIGLSVMVAVAVLVFPLSSVMVYVKLSVPLKSASGVYVKVPLVLKMIAPLAGLVVSAAVVGAVPRSSAPFSLLANTLSVSTSSSSIVNSSSNASGVETMVINTVAVLVFPLSSVMV